MLESAGMLSLEAVLQVKEMDVGLGEFIQFL